MIDYYKLKLAHYLASEYQSKNEHEISIEINFTQTIEEYILHIDMKNSDAFSNIDDLITKLKELPQPQPKYKEEQQVWFVCGKEPITYIVEKVVDARSHFNYVLADGHMSLKEQDLYPSREALIESQIQYWKSLQSGENTPIEECQHENDGLCHEMLGRKWQSKCIKCGEFYK